MARKTGYAKIKYEEQIKNEINLLLRQKISDPRLQLVSITKVELNVDYSIAKLYWDTFDNHRRGDAKKAIEKSVGRLRKELSKVLSVRQIPELKIIYDSQREDEAHIDKLLKETSIPPNDLK